jgi:hypothetical protein
MLQIFQHCKLSKTFKIPIIILNTAKNGVTPEQAANK